jgi:hypothetical protein
MASEALCPACHQGLPVGGPPLVFCPHCGHNLDATPSVPGWVRQGVDLRMVARRQRLLLWFVLAALLAQFLAGTLPPMHPLLGLAAGLVTVGVQITIVICVVQLLSALRLVVAVRALYIVLLLVPCAGIITLLVVNHQATAALRRAGLRVGFMGVKDEDLTRLLDQYRCHTCGYSLIGNVSGRCPECGTLTGLVRAAKSEAGIDRAAS